MSEGKSRVKVGVPGFDEVIEGGIPQGKVVLIAGGPGSGKSIFCMQYLYNGASKFDEPGIFVAIEERPKDLRKDMAKFGMDFKTLEDEKKLVFIDASTTKIGLPSKEKYIQEKPFDIDSLVYEIYRVAKDTGAKRVVLDSIPSLGLKATGDVRDVIYRLQALLLEINTTSFLTTEIEKGTNRISKFGVEEFLCQGVILMHHIQQKDTRVRGIEILKMRGTNHGNRIYPFQISDEGIAIYPEGRIVEEF